MVEAKSVTVRKTAMLPKAVVELAQAGVPPSQEPHWKETLRVHWRRLGELATHGLFDEEQQAQQLNDLIATVDSALSSLCPVSESEGRALADAVLAWVEHLEV